MPANEVTNLADLQKLIGGLQQGAAPAPTPAPQGDGGWTELSPQDISSFINAEQQGVSPVGVIEAIIRGKVAGLPISSLADEIYAMSQSPKGAWQAVKKMMDAEYSPEALAPYEAAKKAYEARQEQAFEEQPLAYGTSALGAFAGGLATGGLGPKALTTMGAAFGGLEALGRAEGDIAEVAGETIGGAGLGALLSRLGIGAAKKQDVAGRALDRAASEKAYRVTGGMTGEIRSGPLKQTTEDIGRELRDRGYIGWFTGRGSPKLREKIQKDITQFKKVTEPEALAAIKKPISTKAIVDKLQQKKLEAGGYAADLDKEAIYKRLIDDFLQARGRTKIDKVTKEIPGEIPIGFRPPGEEVAPKTMTQLVKKRALIPMAPKQALQEKIKFQKQSGWQGNKYTIPKAALEVKRDTAQIIKDAIDEAIAETSPAMSTAYKAEREAVSRLTAAKKAIQQAEVREKANRSISLTDYLAAQALTGTAGAAGGYLSGGGPGAVLGGVAGVAGGMAANKLVRTFGDAWATKTLSGASQLLQSRGLQNGTRAIMSVYGQETGQDILNALGVGGQQLPELE